jgi:hypothetical protein
MSKRSEREDLRRQIQGLGVRIVVLLVLWAIPTGWCVWVYRGMERARHELDGGWAYLGMIGLTFWPLLVVGQLFLIAALMAAGKRRILGKILRGE